VGAEAVTVSSVPGHSVTPHAVTTQPEDPRVRQVELLISLLLRIGVLTSLAIVILGMLISFVRHEHKVQSTNAFADLTNSTATFPHTVPGVLHGAVQLRGRSIIMLGLLLLIATPVMRVAISIFLFIYERDRVYVIVTMMVLALLLLSFVLGRAGE
jgi:uncharacterized membrane protein